GAQKGEVDQAPDIATGDAVALGQFAQRSGASGGKLLKPRSPAGDRLDQRGVTSRAVALYCHSRQHQPHFATAAPEGHRRCKLDWAACSLAAGQRWAHWRSPNRHPPRWAQIVKPDAAATASGSSTVRCLLRLLREPQPPPGLLNRSGSPSTLTGPVECSVGVRAGGCAPECSLRRDRPSRGSLLACGVAC